MTPTTSLESNAHPNYHPAVVWDAPYQFNVTSVCPADITGGGAVNVDDLLAVINAWGTCANPAACPADIAPQPCGNDLVNVDDLLAVINGWGPCATCTGETSDITLPDAKDCMDAATELYTPYSAEWTDFTNKCIEGLRAAGLIP